jgi:hypothetical protein
MLLGDRQYMIDDGLDVLLARPTTYVDVRDGALRDGPASDRVAVRTLPGGAARREARLLPPRGRRGVREYDLDEALLDPDVMDPRRFEDDVFVRLNVFAGVHATLAFLEGLLGRRVRWAFARRRLEVLPWAGEGRNAFYERETGSIRFLEYAAGGRRLLLALSRDIVAHETAHAVLDAVAPDLYDAVDPDGLTVHEAAGDLVALLQTLQDETMLFSAHALFGGQVDPYEALSRFAEELGTDLRRDEGAAALRAGLSDARLGGVERGDPHAASAVVVGALLGVMRERAEASGAEFERGAAAAARTLSRIVVPALNRLPPGEVTLTDLARALDAAAAEVAGGRAWATAVRRELARRGLAADEAELRAPPAGREPLARWPATPARLVAANRERLGVPDGARAAAAAVPFRDRAWSAAAPARTALRAWWDVEEEHDVGPGLPSRWVHRAGVTAVVDAGGVPRSILVGGAGPGARERRGAQLRAWAEEGLLEDPAAGAGGAVRTVAAGDGCARVAGSGRTLHVTQGRRPTAPSSSARRRRPSARG